MPVIRKHACLTHNRMNVIFYTLCYNIASFTTLLKLLAYRHVDGKSVSNQTVQKTSHGTTPELTLLQTDSDMLLQDNVEELTSTTDNEGGIESDDELDKGTPGMDYLGVGYDSIFGNTIGSEDSLLDPGYRAPIISFKWKKSAQGYSSSLKALYPLNGWVRPVYSCGRSSKVEEIKNLDELRNAISASAQLKGDVPSASFSASAKYKREAANIINKSQRMYMHTDMCIRYKAGLPLNIPWDTTEPFKEAIASLEMLDESIKNECSAHDIVETETKKTCTGIKKWIHFFQMFGTHYIHQVTLGGKLVQTMKFDTVTLEKLKKSGFNIDIAVSTTMGAVQAGINGTKKAEASKLDELGSKTLTVIGGEMPNQPVTDQEFAKWANTVAENPMPIGIAAESLTKLMNNSLHSSYAIALYKYAEINGVTYETLVKLGGKAGGLMREIKNGEQVVTVNWAVNGAKCKPGKKILMGFSLLFNPQGTLLGIIPCKRGAYKCDVPMNKKEIRSVSWAICTTGLQPNISQVSEITKNHNEEITATCPPASVVQFGIKLLAKDDRIIGSEPCQIGEKRCQATSKDKKVAGIWIVCSPESYLVDKINVLSDVANDERDIKCRQEENIIAGVKILFLEHPNSIPSAKRSMGIEVCDAFNSKCEVKCKYRCLTSFVMVLCANTNNKDL